MKTITARKWLSMPTITRIPGVRGQLRVDSRGIVWVKQRIYRASVCVKSLAQIRRDTLAIWRKHTIAKPA